MKRKVKIKILPLLLFIMIFVPVVVFTFVIKNSLKEEIVAEPVSETNNYDEYIPVINENNKILNPYYDPNVTIGKTYYDYQGEEKDQENSLVVNGDTYYQNSGIDFVLDKTFDIISIEQGTIVNVKEDDNTGKSIEIKHDNGLISIYQSLSEVFVKKNDIVTKGQIIGKSGTNKLDKDLGNHLHLEIIKNGNSVNPENYLNKEYKKEN